MSTTTKRFVKMSAFGGLALGSGLALAFLSQRFDPLWLIGLLLALPVGLYFLAALPLTVSKTRRLIREVRWWHVLWLLYFVSGLTFRIRGAENVIENPLDAWAFMRVGLVGIVALWLMGWLTVERAATLKLLFRGLIGWLWAYALIGIFSTGWSVYPAWTLYKSMEYLVGVVLIATIIATLHSVNELKRLFDWMWLILGLLMLSVWMGVMLRPQEAVLRGVGLLGIQILGIWPRIAANSVGDLGATIGIVALVRLFYARGNSRKFYSALLLLGLITLILSQSRSPLTGFLLAIPLILFLDRRIALTTLLILTVPLAIFMTPLGEKFWQFFLRGQSEELFFSLSGRIYYWQSTFDLIQVQPLLGFGAYAGGRFLVAKEFASTLSSLHGTWPEILIGTGFMGLVPMVVAVLGTWYVLFRTPRRKVLTYSRILQQLRLEAVGVLTILSVRSIFSVSFIWHPALTWLLVLGFAEFLRRYHALSSHSHALPPTRR